jgi:hypothetical protein
MGVNVAVAVAALAVAVTVTIEESIFEVCRERGDDKTVAGASAGVTATGEVGVLRVGVGGVVVLVVHVVVMVVLVVMVGCSAGRIMLRN